MGMTKKQRKSLARHKAIVKARSIRTNNMAVNPYSLTIVIGRTKRYQLGL